MFIFSYKDIDLELNVFQPFLLAETLINWEVTVALPLAKIVFVDIRLSLI